MRILQIEIGMRPQTSRSVIGKQFHNIEKSVSKPSCNQGQNQCEDSACDGGCDEYAGNMAHPCACADGGHQLPVAAAHPSCEVEQQERPAGSEAGQRGIGHGTPSPKKQVKDQAEQK